MERVLTNKGIGEELLLSERTKKTYTTEQHCIKKASECDKKDWMKYKNDELSKKVVCSLWY